MNEIVCEWIFKSQMDFDTAEREFSVEVLANYDAVCYHYQQAIEKLMKAVLIIYGENPPKTHNLETLSKLISIHSQAWSSSTPDLRLLTHAASDFRYPGEIASKGIAERTRQIAAEMREKLNTELLKQLSN